MIQTVISSSQSSTFIQKFRKTPSSNFKENRCFFGQISTKCLTEEFTKVNIQYFWVFKAH